MKITSTIKSICLFVVFFHSSISPQSTRFSIKEYAEFLNSHQNLSAQELTNMYAAGEFLSGVLGTAQNILYKDSVEIKYNLTAHEKELLNQNGFVVTERVSNSDIKKMFLDIWKKDLPVYISTDAILHAFHRSYDRILKNTETLYIIPQLKNFLSSMHNSISILDKKYGAIPNYELMLKDVDLYLTVARKILDASV